MCSHFFVILSILVLLSIDEGWMLLRYPSGKYVDDCHGYTSTEILFICSHDDEPVSGREVYGARTALITHRATKGVRLPPSVSPFGREEQNVSDVVKTYQCKWCSLIRVGK